jgi:hypothetical protein
LGFDLQLLGSQCYVREKLCSFTNGQIDGLKEIFIQSKHPRFKRELQVTNTYRMENLQIMLPLFKMQM